MNVPSQGATGWHKATYSGANTNCIEQGVTPEEQVAVRDTKNNGVGPVLKFQREGWMKFVASL